MSIDAKGITKLKFQVSALFIFENCLTHHISIDAEWVPKTFNEKADQLIVLLITTIGVIVNWNSFGDPIK